MNSSKPRRHERGSGRAAPARTRGAGPSDLRAGRSLAWPRTRRGPASRLSGAAVVAALTAATAGVPGVGLGADAVATFTVAVSRPEIEEGQSATLTIAVSDGVAAGQDRTVSLAVSGTASADDYELAETELTLPAGRHEVAATVRVTNDGVGEGVETIAIAASVDGASAGTATLTIHPSDPRPRPEPLSNPIRRRIPKGDIVLAVVPFVQAPETEDPPGSEGVTTDAYARVQYLQPVPGGTRLALSDLRGVLYMMESDGSGLAEYLDLRAEGVGLEIGPYPNERGLLGFAFHPEFAQRGQPGYGRFYTAFSGDNAGGVADYLDDTGPHESVVREWTATDPDAGTFAGSSREVLRIGQIEVVQNIGTLAFNRAAAAGSADYGNLYIAMGDGGRNTPVGVGQNLASPLGAILRIDPLGGGGSRGYGIPSDNPFAGVAGVAPEIWAYGLRHPQHFSFDGSGRMFINDIGWINIEEVNIGRAGANYGWRLREGTFATEFGWGMTSNYFGAVFDRPEEPAGTFEYPVVQYDHNQTRAGDEGHALASGFPYEGSEIASLQGKYVFADLVSGRLFAVDVDGLTPGAPAGFEEVRLSFDGVERALLDVAGFPNPFQSYHDPDAKRAGVRLGVDHDGELYLLTKGDGWIRRLTAAAADTAAVPEASVAPVAASVAEGVPASFAVTLDAAAPEALTVSVRVTESGSTLSGAPPTSATVAQGDTGATLAVATVADTVVEADSTVTATLEAGSGYTLGPDRSASVTVEDDDAAIFAVSAAPSTILEGERSTVTAAITNGTTFADDQTITLDFAGSTAAPGTDFTVSPAAIELPAGDASATATVAALGDAAAEGEESVAIAASLAGGVIGTTTLAIRDPAPPPSDDATLSALTLSDVDIGVFAAGTTSYAATVVHGVRSTTVAATPTDPAAAVAISIGADRAAGATRTVRLRIGANAIGVLVTAEDGTELLYTVTVTRLRRPDFEVGAAGNTAPRGMWGNGAVLWVTDYLDSKLYAYDLAERTRLPARDIETRVGDTRDGARYPTDVWSDGETAWVSDNEFDGVYAYRLADGAREPDRDVDLAAGNTQPTGLWGDGETLWVTDKGRGKVYAYALADGSRARSAEFDLPGPDGAGLEWAWGLWSDGESFRVVDYMDRQVYAYRDGVRAAADDVELRQRNRRPSGLWSNGTTLWVSDYAGQAAKLFSYALASPSANASLVLLRLSGVDLGPFSPSDREYEATAPSELAVATLTAFAAEGAGVAVDQADADAVQTGHQVALAHGLNEIRLTVTAADGSTNREYVINVTRPEPSSDATLSALSVSGVDIGAFSASTTRYAGAAARDATRATVAATASDPRATVAIAAGGDSAAGATRTVALAAGTNTITVTVTAEDGTERVYTVAVLAEGASEAGTGGPAASRVPHSEARGFVAGRGGTMAPDLSVSGARLTLRYRAALEAGSRPGPKDWVVRAASDGVWRWLPVAEVSVGGTDAVLALGSPAAPDETVTLSYLAWAVHPLRAAAGAALVPTLMEAPVRNETRHGVAADAMAAEARPGIGDSPGEASNNRATDLWVFGPGPEAPPTRLDLRGRDLEDVAALAAWTGLETLDLSGNALADLWPLAALSGLRRLDLSGNRIADLSALAELRALEVLDLSGNAVADLWPLSGLSNLRRLDLSGNRIDDAWPLAGLARLEVLVLDGNRVAEVWPLAGLSNLRRLDLAGNRVWDPTPLAGLPLERLDLSGNAAAETRPLAGLSRLVWLDVTGNPMADVAPLGRLAALRWLWVDAAADGAGALPNRMLGATADEEP